MKKPPRSLVAWGIGLVLILARAGSGQEAFPAPGGVSPDLNNLARQMADQVQHLGDDISADLGQAPAGRLLIQDTQELAQTVNEFQQALNDNRDPFQARRAFAGIETTWQNLKAQLSQPGASSPAVDRSALRVDQVEAQLRQALGVNTPPPGFYGGATAPTGVADTRRLAYALVSRADALAAAIGLNQGQIPNGAALANDANALARAADQFHDAIDANQPIAVAAQAFAPVDALADRVERFVVNNQVPPRVQDAWQGFASVEVLLHQNLNLNAPQPSVDVSLAPPAEGGPSPIVGLAAELTEQVNAFVAAFAPSSRVVPQGGFILADAQRLQAAAANFQQDTARGLAPNQLAFEFQDVDASWQRLARRVNRIARGRIGPNIAQMLKIGDTCEQIHRVLGMPGYPPVLAGP